MKSKRTKSVPPAEQQVGGARHPSLLDVHDSWIESSELTRQPATCNAAPTQRSTAITLSNEDLLDDDAPQYAEFEAPTVPRKRPAASPGGALPVPRPAKEPARQEPSKGQAVSRSTSGSSRPPARTTSSPPVRTAADVDLSSIPVFDDLPRDVQQMLHAAAVGLRLGRETPIPEFDAVLVVRGSVRVSPGSSAGPSVGFGAPSIITARSSLHGRSVPVIVSADPGTIALGWATDDLERTGMLCPWFVDELRGEGDRVQTILHLARVQSRQAWRETLRLLRLTRPEVAYLGRRERLYERGSRIGSIAMVGIGTIELVDGHRVVGVLGAGELVFPAQVRSRGTAPMVARASEEGATVVLAERDVVLAAVADLPLIAKQLRGGS